MKNIFRFLFVVFCVFTTTNPLHAQWIQTNGPYGGHVYTFAVSGTNLFAGTEGGGVFLSTNNGTFRTLVYHEITTGPYINLASSHPLLSDSGNRALFVHYTYDPRITHIMVINTDGTQTREVHSLPDSYYGLKMDISADGSKVVSSDGRQLFISNADGSGTQKLIEFEFGPINAIRISGDGSKVFFRMFRENRTVNPPGPEMKGGIWVMDANGANLRQIVGPEQVAPLLGVPVDQVPWFSSVYDHSGLDVSTDGSRIVFAMFDKPESGGAGQHLFSVNLNGTGLVSLTDREGFVGGFISNDGTKVAYRRDRWGGLREVGVINSDGSGRRTLASWPPDTPAPFPTGFPELGHMLTLNTDGSKVLLGSTGVLMDTATGATLQLAARGGWWTIDPALVLYDGMWQATMNSSATRFLYVARDANGVDQLVTLDLNPASLGEAPSITEPTINPSYVLTEGRSAVSVSARVTTNNTVIRVSNAVLRDGLSDRNKVSEQVMLDDGTHGDVTVGDGIFTNNEIRASSDAVVGPRTVRIKAEVRASDGKRHSTAVEFGPFEVLVNPPTGVETREQSPTEFVLWQNYPNPFNPTTTIRFSLPQREHVTLQVFDMLGREVATLVAQEMSAGNHSFQWNAATMPSGVYFYRLQAGSYTETKKLVLLR